jgi:hypothetical protein
MNDQTLSFRVIILYLACTNINYESICTSTKKIMPVIARHNEKGEEGGEGEGDEGKGRGITIKGL